MVNVLEADGFPVLPAASVDRARTTYEPAAGNLVAVKAYRQGESEVAEVGGHDRFSVLP